MAPRLEQHRPAAREQAIHQLVDVVLQKRLTTRDFDEIAVISLDRLEHVVDRHPAPLMKGIRGIAPGTAQVARGQPDEDARLTRSSRLALNRKEDLVDNHSIT